MNIYRTFEMPKSISDGRMDLILEVMDTIRNGVSIDLSFEKTEEITAAGYAILFVIFEAVCEQKVAIKISHSRDRHKIPQQLLRASELEEPQRGFYDINKLQIERHNLIVYGKSSSIAPEFITKLESKFEKVLGEDRMWDVILIFNELMQNTVDHSTAERYFLYAGFTTNKFEFGILDLGVSIPAKLETKYRCSCDEEYLEKALVQGVGTRRSRQGGMGLYFLFENVKDAKGRLVILSRNAQIRKNFGTRNYKSSKLKKRLDGTWCMASIPLENK